MDRRRFAYLHLLECPAIARRRTPLSRTRILSPVVPLEDRTTPAVITVTTATDGIAVDGLVSLREALASINGGADVNADVIGSGAYGSEDAINIAATLNGQTFYSPGGTFSIGTSVAIDVFNNKGVIISGSTANPAVDPQATRHRVVDIGSGGEGPVPVVTLRRLGITDGSAPENNIVVSGSQVILAEGGGIRNRGNLTLIGVSLSNNLAMGDGETGARGYGGAISNFGTLTLIQSSLTGNTADFGGAIASAYYSTAVDTSITVSGTSFLNNVADNSGSGGAIETTGDLTIDDALFQGNTAEFQGGAVVSYAGTTRIRTSAFLSNQINGPAVSQAGGAGIQIASDAVLMLDNSTFQGNSSSGYGGSAIAIEQGATVTIVNATIRGNTGREAAVATNGGPSPAPLVAAAVGLQNTIIYGNTLVGNSGTTSSLDYSGPVNSLGGNIVGKFSIPSGGGLFGSTDLTNTDPLLAPLATNGSTQFLATPTAAFLPGSPAIGFGQTPVSGSATDQRGRPRPSGGVYDSGAFQAQRPTGKPDSYTLPQGGGAIAAPGVLGNDTLNDISATKTANYLGGLPDGPYSVSLQADGSFALTADPAFTGTLSFNYSLSDGVTTSSPVAVTVNIPAPIPPTANADAYTVPHAGLTVPAAGVLANDVNNDVYGPLTAKLVTAPPTTAGTFTFNADGSFQFAPTPGFRGVVTFTYVAADSKSTSAPATVTLTVPPPIPPTANPDAYTVPRAGVTVNAPGVLANDVQNDIYKPLRARLVSGPTGAAGTLDFRADGSFAFVPNPAFGGASTFTYLANDGVSDSAPTTVTLTVAAPIPPTANPDAYTVPRAGLTVPAPGVLANDRNNDIAGPLTATLVSPPATAAGTLSFNADGSFAFVSAATFSGATTFTYRVSDGVSASATTTVTLTVPPTANPDTFTVNRFGDGIAAPGVLANDSGTGPLFADLVTPPPVGQLTLRPDGSFLYFAPDNFIDAGGTTTFTYTATDGISRSAPTTVTLIVSAPVPPVARPDAYTVPRAGLTVTAPGVQANDDFFNGFFRTSLVVTPPPAEAGALTLNFDGSFTFTPAATFRGTTTFTYKDLDGPTESQPATVTLTVAAQPLTHLTAVGAGAGGGPRVRVFDESGAVRYDFFAFEPSFDGGVRVAVGDVTGDGVDDIVVTAGPGGGPRLIVVDGAAGTRIADFFALDADFRGGLHLAVADTDGDGTDEVVVAAGATPGSGGGPKVVVLDPITRKRKADFFAYDAAFRGGVRVAAGDLDGDGEAEIVTVAGPSGGPQVKVFTGAGVGISSFFAFDPSYRGGAFVAVTRGQVFVTPDSFADYQGSVFGDFSTQFPDTSGRLPNAPIPPSTVTRASQIYVFDYDLGTIPKAAAQVVDVFAPNFQGGVRVSVGERNGTHGVYVGSGPRGGGRVQFYPLTNGRLAKSATADFPAFVDAINLSVYVGSGTSERED